MHRRSTTYRTRRLVTALAGLALALAMGLVAMSPASAASGTWTTSLYAGQTTLVGTVTVTYDDTDIWVEANLDPGWCATDIAAAAGPLADYTNKAGNPQVGHFPAQQSFSPCVADTGQVPVPMPSDWDNTVAVHVTVANLAEATTYDINSAATQTIYGPTSTPDELATAAAVSGGAVAVTPNGRWADPGGTWISTAPTTDGDVVNGCVQDTYRRVVDTVDVPSGYLFGVSALNANADNAESVMLNGQQLAATSGNPGNMDDALGIIDDQAYTSVDSFPLDGLTSGSNTLTVTFRNYGEPDLNACYSATSNPTGVAFHATYQVASTDTAWAAGSPWGGNNWATYVTVSSP